jgi:ariadne-1
MAARLPATALSRADAPNSVHLSGRSLTLSNYNINKLTLTHSSPVPPCSTVVDVLDIPPSAASILMREHKWAKERLFQAFFDNPDKVQEKCGVKARCSGSSSIGGADKVAKTSGKNRATRSSSKRKHCEICMDDDGFESDEMICMPCGHEFCELCWYGFISNALEKGPLCVRESCPQAGCNELVTEEEVKQAAPDLLPKFESYQLRSFVETYGMTRWCPGAGCEQVAVARGATADGGGIAHCEKCTTSFCLKCGEEPHAPVTCRDLTLWQDKCRNESETANWILANTKPCPKCHRRIEKNQGCNHMTCSGCKFEFCWICMGDWTQHGANTGGYYKCNKYDPNSADDNDQSDAARARRELDRYLHYYKRYHGHSEAQEFAKKSLKETEARMVALQEQNVDSTWTDVEFLKTANEQLVQCRQVLKYTYAFAFYLQDNEKRQRFEFHQEMLEKFTENLTELSEKPLHEMNRTEVVNQVSRNCIHHDVSNPRQD